MVVVVVFVVVVETLFCGSSVDYIIVSFQYSNYRRHFFIHAAASDAATILWYTEL